MRTVWASTRLRSLYMAAYEARRVQLFFPSELSVSAKSRASWSGIRISAPLGVEFGFARQPSRPSARSADTITHVPARSNPCQRMALPRPEIEAIVKVDDPERPAPDIEHHERGDRAPLVLLHLPNRLRDERVRLDRPGRARHHLLDRL